VLAAVARNLPTLVLAREPAAAATDFVRIRPALRFDQAVRGYVRFYEPLLAVIGEVVVARTDQVHADLGEVVGRLNRRFGTAFVPFEHTQANLARVERAASEYFAGRSGPGLPLVGRASSGPVPTTPAPTVVDGVHARYGESSALSRAERLFAALRRESERP
jgi:hypothetical protein